MVIQPSYAALLLPTATPTAAGSRQTVADTAATSDASVTISAEARLALASAQDKTTTTNDARLQEIIAKGPMARTPQEMDYLLTHDVKLAAIRAKAARGEALTSSEVDYDQKTVGLVNTMAMLSPAEKRLYDDMAAAGDSAAAAGMANIAFVRTLGHSVGGPNGTTYDPLKTDITPANLLKLFMHSVVDKTGTSDAQFRALARYLERHAA